MIDSQTTVRNLAVSIPGATRVFEEFKIDYCCRGARTLRDACAADGVELAQIMPQLERAAERVTAAGESTWTREPLTRLVRHILDRHHTYTRDELDRLGPLAAKVERVHGAAHPELATVTRLLRAIDDDLRPHLVKEEHVFSPTSKRWTPRNAPAAGAPRRCSARSRTPCE